MPQIHHGSVRYLRILWFIIQCLTKVVICGYTQMFKHTDVCVCVGVKARIWCSSSLKTNPVLIFIQTTWAVFKIPLSFHWILVGLMRDSSMTIGLWNKPQEMKGCISIMTTKIINQQGFSSHCSLEVQQDMDFLFFCGSPWWLWLWLSWGYLTLHI